MAAMQLGKNVFVEKPMTRTFYEAEIMARMAMNNPKLVTQVGNQGHSGENYFQFKAWKEAGIIKDVTAVTAFMNGSRRWHPYDPNITKFPEAQPLPKGMTVEDWDTWLTTAAYHDFNEKYHPGNWRGWYDFGLGALGDWGAHILDTIHEFLNLGSNCRHDLRFHVLCWLISTLWKTVYSSCGILYFFESVYLSQPVAFYVDFVLQRHGALFLIDNINYASADTPHPVSKLSEIWYSGT